MCTVFSADLVGLTELAGAIPFSASFICLLRPLLLCVCVCVCETSVSVCVCVYAHSSAQYFFQLTLKYAIQYLQYLNVEIVCAECVVLIPLCASPHLFVYFTFIVAASV